MSREVSPKIAWSLIGGAVLVFLVLYYFRDPIKDWWYFLNYNPPSDIVMLADDAGLSEEGRDIFYRADPELVLRREIVQVCPGLHNIGCIVTGPRIYILDYHVETEARYDQAVVTSAHEMLHLAYSRLKPKEKSRVDEMIRAEFNNIIDQKVKERIESYPEDEQLDEAHSIIATEVEIISAELEEYYSQYFEDRQEVLDAFARSRNLID